MPIPNNQHLDLITLAINPATTSYYQIDMFLKGRDFEGLMVVSPVNNLVHVTYSAFRGPNVVVPVAGEKQYEDLQGILSRFLPYKIGELELSIGKSVINYYQGSEIIGGRGSSSSGIFSVPVMIIEEGVTLNTGFLTTKLEDIRDYCKKHNIKITKA